MNYSPIFQAWPTPTPIPTPEATSQFNDMMGGASITLAESLVQGYQQANNLGIVELLLLGMVGFIVIGGIWTIIRHIQSI